MTRQGSLVYYLAAWVCGSFFLSLAVWIHAAVRGGQPLFAPKGAADLLTIYFFCLAFGWFQSLLGGFLLRRFAIFTGSYEAWQWFIVGAVLWPIIILILDKIGGSATWGPNSANGAWTMFVTGAMIVRREGTWIAAPAGGLVGLVLFTINRAFTSRPEPEETPEKSTNREKIAPRKKKKRG